MRNRLKIALYSISILNFLSVPALVNAADSPIKSVDDIIKLANKILGWVSTIFWIAAAIAILYAGFLYMTADGEEEKVGKAKKQLLYGIIAIAVGLMAAGAPVLVESFLRGK